MLVSRTLLENVQTTDVSKLDFEKLEYLVLADFKRARADFRALRIIPWVNLSSWILEQLRQLFRRLDNRLYKSRINGLYHTVWKVCQEGFATLDYVMMQLSWQGDNQPLSPRGWIFVKTPELKTASARESDRLYAYIYSYYQHSRDTEKHVHLNLADVTRACPSIIAKTRDRVAPATTDERLSTFYVNSADEYSVAKTLTPALLYVMKEKFRKRGEERFLQLPSKS